MYVTRILRSGFQIFHAFTGASFARDFLEMERQHQRDDSEFAYDVTEFKSK